jgi:hypothetical protein
MDSFPIVVDEGALHPWDDALHPMNVFACEIGVGRAESIVKLLLGSIRAQLRPPSYRVLQRSAMFHGSTFLVTVEYTVATSVLNNIPEHISTRAGRIPVERTVSSMKSVWIEVSIYGSEEEKFRDLHYNCDLMTLEIV